MTAPTPAPAAPAPEEEPPPARKFSFPSALTILAIVTVAIWLLAFLVPAGQYDRDDSGAPVAGTYHRVEGTQSFTDRLNDLFLSPVNGLYGLQDPKTGQVGPTFSGDLYGSAGVFLFVLAIGAFITVVFATGALDRGIARLAHRLRDRGALLIAAVMVVFSVLGTVEGFAEETLGFYGLLVPMMLALGYDRLVAVGSAILGAGIGVLCSTVNPFATGVASSAAGISLGDGIGLRFLMWIVLTTVTVLYVIRYARRVQKDPAKSICGFLPGDQEQKATGDEEAEPELTGLHKTVLVLLVLVFAFKKVSGRKRGLAVDVLGLIIGVVVIAASAHDNTAGIALLDQTAERCGMRLEKALVDQGFKEAVIVHGALLDIGVEVVRRNPADQGKGFVPQPKRWVVEQTNGTLMLHRRLTREYDHRPDTSASRVYWASTANMARRLTTPTPAWRDTIGLAA